MSSDQPAPIPNGSTPIWELAISDAMPLSPDDKAAFVEQFNQAIADGGTRLFVLANGMTLKRHDPIAPAAQAFLDAWDAWWHASGRVQWWELGKVQAAVEELRRVVECGAKEANSGTS